mgnify:CR=1 FL=1
MVSQPGTPLAYQLNQIHVSNYISLSTMSTTIKLLAAVGGLIVITFGYVLLQNYYLNNDDLNADLSTQSNQDLLALRADDHVYGNRDATVKIIKYSDTRCQYCRWLYSNLLDVVDSYPDGDVALVYRYIPIYRTRDTASDSEITAECVAKQLGDEGFFSFQRNLFARLPNDRRLDSVPYDTATLPALEETGVDIETVTTCIETFSNYDRILKDHSSGGALGVITVPHVFLVHVETIWEIGRAKPAEIYRSAIDDLLEGNKPSN